MTAVCVFCASSTQIHPRLVELAARVGTALAVRGHTLVSGGGSVSMMGAVAAAARAAGGRTIGVIPQSLVDREAADAASDELVVTPTMRARKQAMDDRAEAFLVLPGGLGTLEELFEVWTARVLGLTGKPVVVCDPYDDFGPLHAALRGLRDAGLCSTAALEQVSWTNSVTAAVERCGAAGDRRPASPSAAEVAEG